MSFQPSHAAELRPDLNTEKKDKNNKTKKNALKKVVANMTMNNTEMVTLFADVMNCMAIADLDIKKMAYLYLETYSKARPQLATEALPVLLRDLQNDSPIMRALALRTVSSVPLPAYTAATLRVLGSAMKDSDAYVRKTAAFAAAKAWGSDPKTAEDTGVLRQLNKMLADGNPTVVAAGVAALTEISSTNKDIDLSIDEQTVVNLAKLLPECNEWSQAYILAALTNFVPQRQSQAVELLHLLVPRLQHANASVIMGALRGVLYFSNYISNLDRQVPNFSKVVDAAMARLLSRPPELQYVALRNCILLLEHRPELVKDMDVRTFFCKSDERVYIRTSKIQILLLLANETNYVDVISELRACEVEKDGDATSARRALRALGRLAIKLKVAADLCVKETMKLVATGGPGCVEEGIVSMQQVMRRYPGKYVDTIDDFLSYRETILASDSAKSALFWMCGQYPKEIQDAPYLLSSDIDGFARLPINVQLALLTAAIKLFIALPTRAKGLVPKVFEVATDTADDPDVRDRALMYWRLLSTDANKARDIVMSNVPPIDGDETPIDEEILEELELSVGYLSSVYLKPAAQLFRLSKPRKLTPSPALAPRQKTQQTRDAIPRPPAPRRPQQQQPLGLNRQNSLFHAPQRQRHAPQAPHMAPIVDSPALEGNEFAENEKLIDI